MRALMIFVVVWAAMIAMAFWESYVEGRNPWDRRKLGWKLKLYGKYVLPAYHFYLFVVFIPLLMILPLVIYGWDFKLFGILVSAYFSGVVLEDFLWFVVNPAVKFSDWNPRFANFYEWLRIGSFKIPWRYIIGIAIALLSWFFIWR